MPDKPDSGGNSGTVTVAALTFLAGAAVGAGLALLLAPRPGADTRRALKTSLDEAQASIETSLDRGLALFEEARTRLGEALEAGKEAARRETARLRREWAQAPRGDDQQAPGAPPPGAEGTGAGSAA
jgi:gas vesicle protein